jgi:hypothetical protein
LRFFGGLTVIGAVAALAVPAVGSAQSTQTYTLSGSRGVFGSWSGSAASATEKGGWSAVFDQAVFGSEPAQVPGGGTFSLSIVQSKRVSVTTAATIVGGTVSPIGTVASCTTQSYALEADLVTSSGTGHLSATATVFRGLSCGLCMTYGGSMTGSLTLTQ